MHLKLYIKERLNVGHSIVTDISQHEQFRACVAPAKGAIETTHRGSCSDGPMYV